jgi:hypothetical protein
MQLEAARNQARSWWAGAGIVALVAVAVHAIDVSQSLGGDDVYVLAALRSSSWAHRLFAFNLDAPTAEYMPWWTGVVVQRRFIRVPACALLWLESFAFGRSPVGFHSVTLALVLASCLLLYAEGVRHLTRWKGVAIALLPASHPSMAEIVGSMSSQPLATAGLFALGASILWLRMRERFSLLTFAGAVACVALAVTCCLWGSSWPTSASMVE